MTNFATPFCYEPLSSAGGQIRLLEIAPGTEDAPIRCYLKVHDFLLDPDGGELLGLPEFHAVSYTWGDADLVESIWINDQVVRVRRNCWYALWQARLVRPGCLLWIDAICINQKDNMEKSQQVAIMGKIFFTATAALASLGPHANDSEFLWEQLNSGLGRLNGKRLSQDVELTRIRRAMAALTQRSYWNRMWIVQEVAFSREVHFVSGPDTLHMSFELRRVFDDILLRNDSPRLTDANGAMEALNDTANFTEVLNTATYHKELKRPIGLLLSLFKRFHCADPRDKIYSLLEMADLPLEALVQPDYDISSYKLAIQLLKRGTLCDHNRPASLSNLRLLINALELDAQCIDIVEAIDRKKAGASRRDLEIDHDPELPPFFRRHTTQARLQSRQTLVNIDFPEIGKSLECNRSLDTEEGGKQVSAQPLLLHGQLSGLVSSNARPGDMLFGTFNPGDVASPVLVLRPSDLDRRNTTYTISGRGFSGGGTSRNVIFDGDLDLVSPLEFDFENAHDVIMLAAILDCPSTPVLRSCLMYWCDAQIGSDDNKTQHIIQRSIWLDEYSEDAHAHWHKQRAHILK